MDSQDASFLHLDGKEVQNAFFFLQRQIDCLTALCLFTDNGEPNKFSELY